MEETCLYYTGMGWLGLFHIMSVRAEIPMKKVIMGHIFFKTHHIWKKSAYGFDLSREFQFSLQVLVTQILSHISDKLYTFGTNNLQNLQL